MAMTTNKTFAPEIVPGTPHLWLPYDRYSPESGDVLLWAPQSAAGWAICLETDGPFCHASAVVRIVTRPWQAAYREGLNGYLSPLSAEVRRHSGVISVFRPRDPETGRACGVDTRSRVGVELMGSLSGDYAWPNIALIFAQRSRFLRWLARILPPLRWRWDAELARQTRKRTSAICSQAVARAWREGAGIDLVDGRELPLVTPNDIFRGCRECYLGTLTWPEKWSGNGSASAIGAAKGA
jgi:hypothetical protein